MYYIWALWALLPLTLFLVSIWAFARRYTRRKKRDFVKFYFLQGLFCFFALIVAIGMDVTLFAYLFYGDCSMLDSLDDTLVMILKFLQYPVVLLLLAYAQQRFQKSPKA